MEVITLEGWIALALIAGLAWKYLLPHRRAIPAVTPPAPGVTPAAQHSAGTPPVGVIPPAGTTTPPLVVTPPAPPKRVVMAKIKNWLTVILSWKSLMVLLILILLPFVLGIVVFGFLWLFSLGMFAAEVTDESRTWAQIAHVNNDWSTWIFAFLLLLAILAFPFILRTKWVWIPMFLGFVCLLGYVSYYGVGNVVHYVATHIEEIRRDAAARPSVPPYVEVRFTATSGNELPLTMQPHQIARARATRGDMIKFCLNYTPEDARALRGTGVVGLTTATGNDARDWEASAAVRALYTRQNRPISLQVHRLTTGQRDPC